jgi:hypothetical protein
MQKCFVTIAAIACSASFAGAQQWQGEVHANYARTTQTHSNAWGAGAQVASTWGRTNAPAQLVTSLAGDWQEQENNGPR